MARSVPVSAGRPRSLVRTGVGPGLSEPMNDDSRVAQIALVTRLAGQGSFPALSARGGS